MTAADGAGDGVEALSDAFMAAYDPRNPVASEHAVAAMRAALAAEWVRAE